MAVYLSKKINYEDLTIKRGLYVLTAVPNYFTYLSKKITLDEFKIKKGLQVSPSIPPYFVYLSRKVWRVKKV
jgi:hypothetical protein